MVLLFIFLLQALAQRQLIAISKQGSRELSHKLRKGLVLGLCHNHSSSFISIWSAFWGGRGEVAKESSGRSFLVKKQNLELCCNHVRKERLRTCQTSTAGNKRCGLPTARDSPLGLSKRSGKIMALSWCQQSQRIVEIPGGIGVLKCYMQVMSTLFYM